MDDLHRMDRSESEVRSRLSEAVNEARTHHMNSAAQIVDPWHRRIHNIVASCDETMLTFLEKPDSSHLEFLSTLGSCSLPSGSSWYKNHLEDFVDNPSVLKEIDDELGIVLHNTRQDVHKVMNAYVACVKHLFELDEIMHTKLQKIEDLKKRLTQVIDLEESDTPETCALMSSIELYIRSYYEKECIESDYKAFCKEYARFQALRTIVMATKVAESTSVVPTCSICTHEKITSALIPCGHAFCNNCANKQRAQCYICRCSVRDRQRLYFS